MLLHIGATRRIRLNAVMLSCVALVTRDVVVNFDFWERFPRPRSQQRGRLRPHARRVAVLGVSAGRGRPLPLRRSGVSLPENFGRFLMPNPAFGGNLGQKIKLIEGQPNEYDVICRNASVLAFQLWPAIFAGTAFHRVPAPLHPWSYTTPLLVTCALVGGENAFARCDDGVGNAPQLVLLLRRQVVYETRHDDVTRTCQSTVK